MKKHLAILNPVRGIGTNALDLVRRFPDNFQIEALFGVREVEPLIALAKEFEPNALIIQEEEVYEQIKAALSNSNIKIFQGNEALDQILEWQTINTVVSNLSDFELGLNVILKSLKAKKTVITANVGLLAAAGPVLQQQLIETEGLLIPATNSLCAIFQELLGESTTNIQHITFTANGGPFIDKKTNFLINVKKDHALQGFTPEELQDEIHCINAATLMQKGLEQIVVKWLFNLNPSQMSTVVHPQGVMQSLIHFSDGTIKTQLNNRNHHTGLGYAMSFPLRLPINETNLLLNDYQKFDFAKPDDKTFQNVGLAEKALTTGHNLPCILNTANNLAIEAFLANKINFVQMSEVIEKAMQEIELIENPNLEDLMTTHLKTQDFTKQLITNIIKNNSF